MRRDMPDNAIETIVKESRGQKNEEAHKRVAESTLRRQLELTASYVHI